MAPADRMEGHPSHPRFCGRRGQHQVVPGHLRVEHGDLLGHGRVTCHHGLLLKHDQDRDDVSVDPSLYKRRGYPATRRPQYVDKMHARPHRARYDDAEKDRYLFPSVYLILTGMNHIHGHQRKANLGFLPFPHKRHLPLNYQSLRHVPVHVGLMKTYQSPTHLGGGSTFGVVYGGGLLGNTGDPARHGITDERPGKEEGIPTSRTGVEDTPTSSEETSSHSSTSDTKPPCPVLLQDPVLGSTDPGRRIHSGRSNKTLGVGCLV